MGHGHGHPHGWLRVRSRARRRPMAKTRAIELGDAARERRQGIRVHLAHGQCVSRADFCRFMRAIFARRRWPRSTATRRSSRRCATPGRLEGKCGACEYKEICGGSRARAYALTGDPLAQEPCCIYQPKNWDPTRHAGEVPAGVIATGSLVTLIAVSSESLGDADDPEAGCFESTFSALILF